jgi:hypothetical protein
LWVSVGGVVTQLENEKILDVSSISLPAPEAEYGEEYITTSSTTYSGAFTIDLTQYTSYKIPVDYVEFHITPLGLNEGGENNDELEAYKEKQIYKILVNQSGQKLNISRVNTTSPIINAVNNMNPQYDASGTGSPRYLVYNNPDATVAVSLSSANCPVSRSGNILYTANLGSVGVASTPVPTSYNIGDLSNITSCCNSSCTSGKDKHIQFVGDNSKHSIFLLNKLPYREYCATSRSRH